MDMSGGSPQRTVFPGGQDWKQPLAAAFQLLVLCALSSFLSLRAPSSIRAWRSTSIIRTAVVALLADCLVFVLTATWILLGLGSSYDDHACYSTLWLCITFYSLSKLLTSVFLIERVHIVVSNSQKRWNSSLYRLNLLVLVAWVGIFIGLCFSRKTQIQDDQTCIFDVNHTTVVIALVLDIVTNLYLALLFVIPLKKGSSRSPALSRLASRSLVAAIIATAASAANISFIVAGNGMEEASFCLVACSADVFLTCSAVFWVTSNESSKAEGSSVENVPVQVIAMRQSLKIQSERLGDSMLDQSTSDRWERSQNQSTSRDEGGGAPFSSLSENPERWRGDIIVVREEIGERV